MKQEFTIGCLAVVIGGLVSCGDPSPSLPDSSEEGRGIILGTGLGETPNFLSQNWTDAEANAYYNASQGSRMMPYDWFLHLELADSTTLFRDASHVLDLGYIPRAPDDDGNPDGLPIGFARDGNDIGLTCAACHTGQINFKGKAWLVDGAPTMADAPKMMRRLVAALHATHDDAAKFARFASAVLGGESAEDKRAALKNDLNAVIEIRVAYNTRNFPAAGSLDYGPGRLDAFGAIMNQVAVVFAQVPDAETGNDAPVSYPFLWDTPQHDRVQWNGSAENTTSDLAEPIIGTAHVGALGRNIGEVLGVFAEVDTSEFTSVLGGYDSSVQRSNVIGLEESLRKLWSPTWPEEFGAIDQGLADKGAILYAQNCRHCHAILDRTDPDRKVTAVMGAVGTDETMARNVATRTAKSGVLQGRRMLLPPFRKLSEEEPIAKLLTHVSQHVLIGSTAIAEDFEIPNGYVISAQIEDGASEMSVVMNAPEMENGRLKPATVEALAKHVKGKILQFKKGADLTDVPEELAAKISEALEQLHEKHAPPDDADDAGPEVVVKFQYKARPLNGVWATAPYLHAGSVLNLDELLKPAAQRLTSFKVGSLEFDPVRVGFVDAGDFVFDTTAQPANGNSGHEYGDKVFSAAERAQLIEYIKSL